MAAFSFPAGAQDLTNHVFGYFGYNHQVHAVLELGGTIEEALLEKALGLAVRAEPILGCRLVEDDKASYWQQREDVEGLSLCSLVNTQCVEQELQQFICSPLNACHDPLIHVRIFRKAKKDTLCLKINHVCCDGGGIKDCLALLVLLYNRLRADAAYQIPSRTLHSREQERIFQYIPIREALKAWDLDQQELQPGWTFPCISMQNAKPDVAVQRIEKEPFLKLAAYGKQHGATINDIVLTALYRALFEMIYPEAGKPMPVGVTVDLRRYLPEKKAGMITNLSGVVNPAIPRIPGEKFAATLARVAANMRELKANAIGFPTALTFEMYSRLGFSATYQWFKARVEKGKQDNCVPPVLSNVGIISESKMVFDKVPVTDAYITGPLVPAPGSLIIASTYEGVLTLTMGYYKAATSPKAIQWFLKQVAAELSF